MYKPLVFLQIYRLLVLGSSRRPYLLRPRGPSPFRCSVWSLIRLIVDTGALFWTTVSTTPRQSWRRGVESSSHFTLLTWSLFTLSHTGDAQVRSLVLSTSWLRSSPERDTVTMILEVFYSFQMKRLRRIRPSQRSPIHMLNRSLISKLTLGRSTTPIWL